MKRPDLPARNCSAFNGGLWKGCLIGMHAALSAKGASRATKPRAKQIRLKEPFSVDEPRYLLGQVAAAAGITADLLKTWIAREVIVLGEHDRDAHGKGSSRVFTLRRALIVAATAELVRLGMATSRAGTTGKIEIDVALRWAKGDPLQIFSFTIFQPTTEYRRTIVAADPNLTLADILNFKGNPGYEEPDEGPAVSFMLLNLKALVERVLRRLGELDEPMDTKRT